MTEYKFIPLSTFEERPIEEIKERSAQFLELMRRRRTVRQISDRSVPREIIENCLLTAGTAPSGANMQPWTFVVVSDPEVKSQIRVEAEKVEADFYTRKAPDYWLEALTPAKKR